MLSCLATSSSPTRAPGELKSTQTEMPGGEAFAALYLRQKAGGEPKALSLLYAYCTRASNLELLIFPPNSSLPHLAYSYAV